MSTPSRSPQNGHTGDSTATNNPPGDHPSPGLTLRAQAEAVLARWSSSPALVAWLGLRFAVDTGPPYPRRGRAVRCVVFLTFPLQADPAGEWTIGRAFDLDLEDPAASYRRIMSVIIQQVAHELGEGLLFDGEPFSDPHASPSRWPFHSAPLVVDSKGAQ